MTADVEEGVTDTDEIVTEEAEVAGLTVTVARLLLLGSAELVAMTATVCEELTDAGALYKPDVEIEPTAGETDQVTAVFVDPLTLAVNWSEPPAVTVAVEGETLTATEVWGETEIVKLFVAEFAVPVTCTVVLVEAPLICTAN